MQQKPSVVVHWKFILFSFAIACIAGGSTTAQTQAASRESSKTDSLAKRDTIVFAPSASNDIFAEESQPKALKGIFNAGAGIYQAVHNGEAVRVLEPVIGFDFFALPGSTTWGFLLGAGVGFNPKFSTQIHLGLRFQLAHAKPINSRVYLDGSALFFEDGENPEVFQTGARLALAYSLPVSSVSAELRLAGEYRGSRTLDDGASKPLWWAGAEVGISFDLIGTASAPSRTDSLYYALRWISSDEEMDDLRAQRSDYAIDEWLDRFWRKRDVTPQTPDNEARTEFEERMRLANQTFSRNRTMGVKTDPGRVVLIYGKPDQKLDYSGLHDMTSVSSSPWTDYMLFVFENRIKGYSNASFLFSSTSGGEWHQIYSNVAGEATGPLPSDLPIPITHALPPFVR